MSACCTSCGSAALPCGCCEGVSVATPAAIHNRPGLPQLRYRVGTHASFFASMQARLASAVLDDGRRPLAALTTRDRSDFSMALLDGWATVADLLSFYQERIANEGYLRTATERRSVLELARLVGYTPRPGVAASVHLAYTLDDNQTEPTVIAAGARAQSLPGPGETPQAFETSDDLDARREWNNLQVRLTRPQRITLESALLIDCVVVADSVNTLRAGDPLLLLFSDDGSLAALRTVRATVGPAADGKSTIQLDPVPADLALTIDLLTSTVSAMQQALPGAGPVTAQVIRAADGLLRRVLLDPAGAQPRRWAGAIQGEVPPGQIDPAVLALIEALRTGVNDRLEAPAPPPPSSPTSPDVFVRDLLKPRVLQARNSLQLRRDLGQAFAFGADAAPQLLLNFAPPLQGSYYQAWRGASENAAQAELVGVYVLRSSGALFGASVPRLVTVTGGNVPPQNEWQEWTLQGESPDGLFLDRVHSEIAAPSYAIVRRMDGAVPQTQVLQVMQATTTPRTAYGISGQSTHLRFDRDWWEARVPGTVPAPNDMAVLRTTRVWAQSVALTLADEPITDDVGSQPGDEDGLRIELAALHQELPSGRWVILQGERADIDGVAGVQAAELMMVASLVHGYDATLPGDKVHTTLQLATRSAYRYKRDTLVVWGNVARATHGETRDELLGSGDAAQMLQRFTLKQPPLTFVSAATAAGAQSTLAVQVDGVRWHETASLAWLGAKDRGYVTRTDDEGNTQIIFGDGLHGARPPSGVQNVRAVYRSGIGAPGNARAQQISLLGTRPLGVKAVINPLRASGGADREDRDLARANAPLAVMALDRLVSMSDYADFARTFAGVAKALATRASDGGRDCVLLSIAGVDDAPIDKAGDLYRNLLAALRQLGDPDLPLRVEPRELLTLVLQAGVALQPDHVWETVAAAVRATLLARFGFGQRALGQHARLAEVISVMQGVRGVAYVDVDAFGAVPEKRAGADGVRQLVTQSEINGAVNLILHAEQPKEPRSGGLSSRLPPDVMAFPGGAERGVLRPAELALFTPAVADTLILNPLS